MEGTLDKDGKPTTATIVCPICSHAEMELMPIDACQYLYDCKGCGALLRPKTGDCCVFCSYGDVRCPPVETGRRQRQASSCC